MRERALQLLPALAVAALLVGGWELYVDLAGVEAAVLPAPHDVAAALWNSGELLLRNFKVTALEVVLGLGMALSAGLALAVAIHLSPVLRRAFYPLAVGSQALPIPVIGVLLVFWWGFGMFPKLAIIALICFFPVLVTTVDGLGAVDPEQLKLMRTLDGNRWQAFRFAELPPAPPAAKRFTVMLDFFPKAAHAALYSAISHGDFRAVGLDVQPQAPADPAEPLKLLAAGKLDMAISYEPEVLLARDEGLKLVSVG